MPARPDDQNLVVLNVFFNALRPHPVGSVGVVRAVVARAAHIQYWSGHWRSGRFEEEQVRCLLPWRIFIGPFSGGGPSRMRKAEEGWGGIVPVRGPLDAAERKLPLIPNIGPRCQTINYQLQRGRYKKNGAARARRPWNHQRRRPPVGLERGSYVQRRRDCPRNFGNSRELRGHGERYGSGQRNSFSVPWRRPAPVVYWDRLG